MSAIAQIRPHELALRLSATSELTLLDVRELWEFEICHIQGSLHIPMGQIPTRIDELSRTSEFVVICHHGVRSQNTAIYLYKQGFTNILNLYGGIDAWAKTVDKAMAVY